MKKQNSIIHAIKHYYTFAIMAIMLVILLSVSTIYFFQLKHSGNYINPEGVHGIFDFSDINFTEQNYVRLQGNVEFYWNQFLTPDDFAGKTDSLSPRYLEIPKEWNNLRIDGKKIGNKGYGTYRFKIHVGSPGLYSIKIKEFESAFQLWINSEYYEGAGKVGTSRKDMIPSWHRQEYDFYVPGDTVEVILQISNYHHRLGGASEPIFFGSEKSIMKIKKIRLSVETFLMGILIILIIYHLTLYHYRREDKSLLYFSLTCLAFLLRLSTSGEKLLLEFFPFIPWSVAIRIEYISIPLIGFALINFIHYMLPESIPSWFRRSINIITFIFSAIILFMPATLFTYIILLVPVTIAYLVIGLFFFLLRAVMQKKKNAQGLFWGFIMLYIVMINDILVYFNLLESSYLLPFGLILLLFIQAIIISRNSSLAYIQVEMLSKELEKYTEELEELVSLRTQKLQERNSEIELQKNKIENQAAILDQTNRQLLDLVKFKKDMTRMMVHDLKNPLSNVIGFMHLPEITDKIRNLIITSGNEMQNLIQNILDVAKYDESRLDIHPMHISLHELIDTAYHQNEYSITLNNIRFENLVEKDQTVNVDKDLIIRVLTNIMSNATKHGNENGLIKISADKIREDDKDLCKVSIFNTGDLIPEDKLDVIFDIYNQIYSPNGQYQYSSGIGLAFCKMTVEAHGGRIGAISEEDKGVTFWFTLPVDNK